MTLATFRCPSCGDEVRALARSVDHPCPKKRDARGRPKRVEYVREAA